MSELAAVQSGGRSLRVFGIVTMILGVLAMLSPLATTMSITLLVGVLVLAAGLVRMFWALQAGSLGKGLLVFAIGGLTLLCGAALLANPLLTAGVMSVVLIAYFIVDGISEIVAALHVRPESGWGSLLFGGTLSLALGVMIWQQAPLAGAWAIGIFLGLKLFFAGLIITMVDSNRPLG